MVWPHDAADEIFKLINNNNNIIIYHVGLQKLLANFFSHKKIIFIK